MFKQQTSESYAKALAAPGLILDADEKSGSL